MVRKRIAIIASISTSLINFRGELIKKWIELGHEVYACAPDFECKIKDKLECAKVKPVEIKLFRTGLNPFKDLVSLYSLYKTLNEINPDVVYSYTIKPVIYASIASKLAGVDYISSLITGLGYTFSGNSFTKKIINRVTRILYKISLSTNKLVLFQNEDDRKLFVDLKLVDEGKTAVVNGSGVNTSHFYYSPYDKNEVSFLMICRLLKSKGIYEYIKAAEMVKRNYPDVEFNVVGPYNPGNPDSIDEDILKRAEKEGIINYHGRKDDVRPFIEDSSVYVLPSYREGTPRSVLEAMSMGRPIITTDVPGCRETVDEGVNGFLVSEKNYEQLVDRMLYFINNKDKIREMGDNSRRIAEEKYDVHKVNEDIINKMGL